MSSDQGQGQGYLHCIVTQGIHKKYEKTSNNQSQATLSMGISDRVSILSSMHKPSHQVVKSGHSSLSGQTKILCNDRKYLCRSPCGSRFSRSTSSTVLLTTRPKILSYVCSRRDETLASYPREGDLSRWIETTRLVILEPMDLFH